MIRATGYMIWRLCRIVCGFILLAAGLFLSLPGIPGPGFVLIALSFGILSHDFHWAKRAQEYVHRKWHELRNRQTQASQTQASQTQASMTKETDHG